MADNREANTGKEGSLPLDAKLLSDAVIELNISRRSVGLYPPGHSAITSAIERAYALLQKLFELRDSITLGIAKDYLVVDDNVLDKKNPVFRECALSFHEKGIAGITFQSGLAREELVGLHEILTSRESAAASALQEQARARGLSHIKLSPIDYSAFRFMEGAQRTEEQTGKDIWEDYVYGLLEGRLTADDSADALLEIPEEKVAELINAMPSDAERQTYDRVITSYLRGKGESGLSPEAVNKLMAMINHLSPSVKQKFLSKTFDRLNADVDDVEKMLEDMTIDNFQQMARFFEEQSSMASHTLQQVIDRLRAAKGGQGFAFDMLYDKSAVLHDIEVGREVMNLFDEKPFRTFASEEYSRNLKAMLAKSHEQNSVKLEELKKECTEEAIDRTTSEIMLELLEADVIDRDHYQKGLSKLTQLAGEFVNTGRFAEARRIYGTIRRHCLEGRFSENAERAVNESFESGQLAAKIVEAARLWGRSNREELMGLVKEVEDHVTGALFDALTEEQNAGVRKFFLSTISELCGSALPEAARRLDDRRWYVLRNMIYLLRECGGKDYAGRVSKFAKHPDPRVCIEALKALVEFRTADSVAYLKFYMKSRDERLSGQAVKIAGSYGVAEAVPFLLEMLEQKERHGAEAGQKIAAVKALGKIKDPRALGPLKRILQHKPLLHKGGLDDLKLEIVKSLAYYPREAARPLLEEAKRSRNDKVRSISEKILRRQG